MWVCFFHSRGSCPPAFYPFPRLCCIPFPRRVSWSGIFDWKKHPASPGLVGYLVCGAIINFFWALLEFPFCNRELKHSHILGGFCIFGALKVENKKILSFMLSSASVIFTSAFRWLSIQKQILTIHKNWRTPPHASHIPPLPSSSPQLNSTHITVTVNTVEWSMDFNWRTLEKQFRFLSFFRLPVVAISLPLKKNPKPLPWLVASPDQVPSLSLLPFSGLWCVLSLMGPFFLSGFL